MKLGIIACLMLAGCGTHDVEATKSLDDLGFSNITITDRGSWFANWNGCGDDDGHWYEATANNAAGKRVNVVVCCGSNFSFKSCTVRSR